MRVWPTFFGLAVALAALTTGLATPGASLAVEWQMAARYTARVGFFLLLTAYLARPLVQLAPSRVTKALLRDRRWWGLGFAASHTVHLYALIMAHKTAGTVPDVATLIGGGFGYVLLYAMVLTSTNRAQAAMGVWWKRLHRFGIHYLWFIFTLSYFGRLMEAERATIGWTFFPIAILAALIRFSAWRTTRRS